MRRTNYTRGGGQYGGAYIRPFYGQKGQGFTNLIGSLFKNIVPKLFNIAKPAIKRGITHATPHLLKMGQDVVADTLSGTNIKTALRKRGAERIQDVIERKFLRPHTRESSTNQLIRTVQRSKKKRKKTTNRRQRGRGDIFS